MNRAPPLPIIAVVDDEDLIRSWLDDHLSAAGYRVCTAASCAEGIQCIRESRPALMLLDLRLPDGSGLDVLSKARTIDPDLIVVIVTAFGDVETAVQAVKAGAYHFLQKPIDLDDLLITINAGLEARKLRQKIEDIRELHRWRFANIEIVGESSATREIVSIVEKVARTDSATVLLQGESGTGKDLFARAIHARSSRYGQPFLEVNCSALPEQLLESELFGHERGAFTDARERKKGLAELADGGTLFLDEIGDMPPGAQAKLLRFLEDSTFKRLGGTTDLSVDIRVIAATNRDLDRAVEEKAFRGDLYYRLNVVPIYLPALRDRPEDIEPLARYFVSNLARDLRRDPPELLGDAIDVLRRYRWPGNVRELRNVLERTLILNEGASIRADQLLVAMRGFGRERSAAHAPIVLPAEGLILEELERDLIQQALARSTHNVTQAAKLLGLSRDTLRYRLEKYGLDEEG